MKDFVGLGGTLISELSDCLERVGTQGPITQV